MKITDQNIRNMSGFFDHFHHLRFGEIHIKQHEPSGLLAIIAIHSTRLGPALGGCRFLHYSTGKEAVIDALRLAQLMSYKAAACDLALGGGKAVIIKPPHYDRVKLFQAFGQFVHSLGGQYITAEDSGTSVDDMDIIRGITPFVTGDSHQPFITKDPSLLTALGVTCGIKAAVKYKLKTESLEGIHVAIQGVGHVGYHLAKNLFDLGAKLTVGDINLALQERCRDEFHANVAPIENFHQIKCDIFSPCALGNAVTRKNVREIQAHIIAGSANNQLENAQLAQKLRKRGILYAPDYVINSGGLLHVYAQLTDQSESAAKERVKEIYQKLLDIFEQADKENQSTLAIIDRIAEQKLYG